MVGKAALAVTDVLVIGAGPAGALAALRAPDLAARTVLVSSAELGGIAANDGPVPVRTLAHAVRLLRAARKVGQYRIEVSEPALDYARLLARVREVVNDVRSHSSLQQQIDASELLCARTPVSHASTIRRRWLARRQAISGRETHRLHRWRQPAPADSRLRPD
jgi:pyruvate/2-oxoglutarate dehydrogenase complex dihydrolipoamide dehydrogenase (E3) component